jgi:hypothetical protein
MAISCVSPDAEPTPQRPGEPDGEDGDGAEASED